MGNRKFHTESLVLNLRPDRLIWSQTWESIFKRVRYYKMGRNFGYGIELDVDDFGATKIFRELTGLPLHDKFYFLITNRRSPEFPIHVDGTHGNRNVASINWPLMGCDEQSVTQYYHFDQMRFDNVDGSYFISNPEDGELAGSVVLKDNQPVLFRSDIPHRGYCGRHDNQMRVIVKWGLYYGSWTEACKAFRDADLAA